MNQTFFEPDISHNFESGWYVQREPSITYDWIADLPIRATRELSHAAVHSLRVYEELITAVQAG